MSELKVLIVDDDEHLAAYIEVVVVNAGAAVIAKVASVADAIQIVTRQEIDVACLDIDLGSEDSSPVADALAARKIPFFFATGRDRKHLPPRHRARPFLSKSAIVGSLGRAHLVRLLQTLAPMQADQPS